MFFSQCSGGREPIACRRGRFRDLSDFQTGVPNFTAKEFPKFGPASGTGQGEPAPQSGWWVGPRQGGNYFPQNIVKITTEGDGEIIMNKVKPPALPRAAAQAKLVHLMRTEYGYSLTLKSPLQ